MTIVYRVGKGLYVNLTNRCPCACTFCIRQNGAGVYGSDSLWLEREPTVAATASACRFVSAPVRRIGRPMLVEAFAARSPVSVRHRA